MTTGLTPPQLEAWQTDGYCVVENILTADEVRAVQEEAWLHVPSREQRDAMDDPPGGAGAWLPFAGQALNQIPFHPRIIAIAEQLIGTRDIRLTHSLISAKYGGFEGHVDDDLHQDYAGSSLLAPHYDGRFLELPVIFYLTDVGIENSPTYVVARRHEGGRGTMPPIRPRTEQMAYPEQARYASGPDPDLYAHEVPILAPAGSALVYTQRTWHRGSKASDPKSLRLIHHGAYRAAGNDWLNHTGWADRFWSGAYATTGRCGASRG